MLIQQLLVQETTGWWHGLKRVVCPLFPVLARLMLFSGRLWFRVRYHQSLIARPDQAIGSKMFKQERQTSDLLPPRLLFIHAENDPFITLHHTHRLVTIAHAAGRSIQVYYTSCAIHCGSYGHDPQQYMTLLQRFVAL
ncbi:MAG TPA: hypothetical protein VFN35_34020 [Ktedonobacteraceae bacterium]|nr:hypothetical protein [Ktedonobacteraceae bacterium]